MEAKGFPFRFDACGTPVRRLGEPCHESREANQSIGNQGMTFGVLQLRQTTEH
jgi:hypothetical protein